MNFEDFNHCALKFSCILGLFMKKIYFLLAFVSDKYYNVALKNSQKEKNF